MTAFLISTIFSSASAWVQQHNPCRAVAGLQHKKERLIRLSKQTAVYCSNNQ